MAKQKSQYLNFDTTALQQQRYDNVPKLCRHLSRLMDTISAMSRIVLIQCSVEWQQRSSERLNLFTGQSTSRYRTCSNVLLKLIM